MKNIQVILHSNKEVTNTYDVIEGQLLNIENTRGVNYELFNAATGTAPQNIIAKRVGQDLFIILDENEGSGSPDEMEPDVVIQGYYGEDRGEEGNTDATGILVGLHENGKYYAYIPESAETQDAVSVLADGMQEPQAIGGEELACGAFFFPWWALLGLLPLAFLAHSDGGDDKPASKPSLELIKSGDVADDAKAGDEVAYTFTVTNTGNVKITDLSIADAKVTDIVFEGGKTELAPGESVKATGKYVLTQDDLSRRRWQT